MLLVLFPVWLFGYTQGVVHNSDGAAADLKIHAGAGLGLFAGLLPLHIAILVRVIRHRGGQFQQ